MPEFFKRLVGALPIRAAFSRGPQAVVGAFGKHPAWNDHIDPDTVYPAVYEIWKGFEVRRLAREAE